MTDTRGVWREGRRALQRRDRAAEPWPPCRLRQRRAPGALPVQEARQARAQEREGQGGQGGAAPRRAPARAGGPAADVLSARPKVFWYNITLYRSKTI